MVVAAVALLVFGPDKLPEIASQLGKISFQLKRTSDAFRREFYNSVYKPAEEQQQTIRTEFKVVRDDVRQIGQVEQKETKQEEPKEV